jgi:hypothetical protein
MKNFFVKIKKKIWNFFFLIIFFRDFELNYNNQKYESFIISIIDCLWSSLIETHSYIVDSFVDWEGVDILLDALELSKSNRIQTQILRFLQDVGSSNSKVLS